MSVSYPVRRLCAGMILNAMRDTTGRHGISFAQRAHALAWLASTKATLYFEAVSQDQARALLRSDWRENALEVLHAERADLAAPEDLDLISDTLDYLNYLEERSTV